MIRSDSSVVRRAVGKLAGILALVMACEAWGQAPLPAELEAPECLGINKEPAHATLMAYASLKEALAANRSASSFCRSLNGQWKFHWVRTPELRPVEFYRPDFDASGWAEIPVPSNWQLLGYGTPFYRNMGYTFQKDWPHVLSTPPTNYTAFAERDPVGSYRREFEVPAGWQGRRVFLRFDGVDSAFYVWVNGEKVGYSVNSRNAAEFDITRYLKTGKNLLAVEVYTYSAGSYLEDQDMWRLSGIFRNVTLWSAPAIHVRDFLVKAELDSQYRDASVTVAAKVRNYGALAGQPGVLRVELFDQAGRVVARGETVVPVLKGGEERALEVSFAVANPAQWTAETPNLYTTVLSLSGTGTSEWLSTRTGFRKIELRGRLFTVNGVPVKLKGANRHENWPDTGHYVTEERMIKDLEVLKQGNCNHVRTCHYSDDPRWYELCDEWGIYLTAEANVECHGYYNTLDREPTAEKAIIDRNIANVENFKNHPSVIMWSLGNECGGGRNFVSALKAVKAIDATRPVHFESFGIGAQNPADVDSRMYTNPEEVRKIAADGQYTKPFYLCEFAHAMFNSMGNLDSYNDVIDTNAAVVGGAIWEWEDQGMWNRRDPNRVFLAFGGGFGDFPNDHYFIHKGVVFSDRSPKPHYAEMKRVFQWIGLQAEPAVGGSLKVQVRNKYAFINLDRFKGGWTLTEDGRLIDQGRLAKLAVAPGQEAEVTITPRRLNPKPGAEYFLRVGWTLAQDERWARAGYEVASAQFKLPVETPAPVADVVRMPSLQLKEQPETYVVKGSGFSVSFDRLEGTISQLVCGGRELLIAGGGPKPHLWRAAHRNDDLWAGKNWEAFGLDRLHRSVVRTRAEQVGPAVVRVEMVTLDEGDNGFRVVHAAYYTVYGDGSIAVDNAMEPKGARIALARLGVRMQLAKEFDRFAYLGRGPMENYSDRKRGSDVGLYGSSVREQLTPYAKPMECGNHEDVRWAALTGKGLPTLLAVAEKDWVQVSALPYTDEVLNATEYSIDLPATKSTVLTIAAHTLGVGSSSCGPRPRDTDTVWSDPATFSYVLRLLPPSRADGVEAGRVRAPQERVKPTLESLKAVATSPKGRIHSLSSFEPGEGIPEHAVDGQSATFWHSRWSGTVAEPPHFLVLDYGRRLNIAALVYVARVDGENGHVKDYEIYVSDDGREWGDPVATGRFDRELGAQTIRFSKPTPGRYLKFVAVNSQDGRPFVTVAELEVVEAPRASMQAQSQYR